MGLHDDLAVPIDVECPRCHSAVRQPFYGPCTACLDELRSMYQSEVSEMAAMAYEPKMNVTPNAVALKDD